MTKIRVGMGQILVEPGKPEENLARAVDCIGRAAQSECDIVVLPECLDLGWTYPDAPSLAEPIPGSRSERLAQAAAANRIYVAAGLTEQSGHLLHNAAIFISPHGELLLKHRKINELDIATPLYTTGTSLEVATTELGKIGMTICADCSPAALPLGHAVGLMGARLLVSPSAWAVPPEHDNEVEPYGGMWIDAYRELAKAHRMPVVGVSNVGPVTGGAWDGWRCIGCSLAVNADGEVIAQGPYGHGAEALLVVDLDIERL